MSLIVYGLDIEHDVLYGLIAGWNCLQMTDSGPQPHKSWTLHFYTSKQGRKRGMEYQKREYVDCDFLTFELKAADLFKMSSLQPVILKDRGRVVADILKFIKERS